MRGDEEGFGYPWYVMFTVVVVLGLLGLAALDWFVS